ALSCKELAAGIRTASASAGRIPPARRAAARKAVHSVDVLENAGTKAPPCKRNGIGASSVQLARQLLDRRVDQSFAALALHLFVDDAARGADGDFHGKVAHVAQRGGFGLRDLVERLLLAAFQRKIERRGRLRGNADRLLFGMPDDGLGFLERVALLA